MSDFDQEVIEKVIGSILDSDKSREDKIQRIVIAVNCLFDDEVKKALPCQPSVSALG